MRLSRPSDQVEEEITTERKELLRATLESLGWTEIIRPLLALKMERIARLLATDASRSLEDTRLLQGRYRALQEILSISTDSVKLLFED